MCLKILFIKLHTLHHAAEEEVFGIGPIEELAGHGYDPSPSTLYPTLGKMEDMGWLSCEARVVKEKQWKYYRIMPEGQKTLTGMKYKIEELYQEIIKGH